MTTITISYDESKEAVARVESALEETAKTDTDWNGADFVIERDDFTCIDCDDEYAGIALLNEVIYPALKDRQ